MNSEKIKELWKDNVAKEIDSYSDAEIEAIILKKARKAIGLSYPGIAGLSFLVLETLFCLWFGFVYFPAPRLRLFWIVCIVISVGGIGISIFSRRKMEGYSYELPLKDWVASRIREFDRGIHLKKIHWFLLSYGIGFLLLLLFCAILVWSAGFMLPRVGVSFATGSVFVIVFAEVGRRSSLKRMTRSREKLQELYDQLED